MPSIDQPLAVFTEFGKHHKNRKNADTVKPSGKRNYAIWPAYQLYTRHTDVRFAAKRSGKAKFQANIGMCLAG
jgi:hypothetical protein